jgi:ureidoacrylate peracid hydrolase
MHKLEIDPWFLTRAKQARGGRLNAYETLRPTKTALVVVDMQNYFVADGMPSCIPHALGIVPNINRLAEAARTAGAVVAWIQTEALPDRPDDWANRREATAGARWSRRQALLCRNGDGFGFYAGCEVRPQDAVIVKTRYSAFIPHPSGLDTLLRERAIDTVLVTGVATSTCCDSTARDASMWGYRAIMVADANADHTDSLHNHTLGKFLVTFGDVRSTDEVIALLGGVGGVLPQ